MKSDIIYEKSIEILCEWVQNRGHEVRFQKELGDQLSYEDKIIFINTRQGMENQLYSLLHECGHLLVYLSHNGFERDHPMYAYKATKRQEKTKKCKVSVIGEEYEAWKRGRKLAKRLDIEVNKDKFDLAMTKALMSYFKWAANNAYYSI